MKLSGFIKEMKRSLSTRITYSYTGGILLLIALIVAVAFWKIIRDWSGDIFDLIVAEKTILRTVLILIAILGLMISSIVVLIGFPNALGDPGTKKKGGPNN